MTNNRFRKAAATLTVLATSVFGLSACGGKADEKAETTASASGTVEVWDYLGQGVSDTAMKSTVAAFEKANPGIKVKRTSFAYGDLAKSIVQGGVGGQVPDLAIVDVVDTQNFASLGLLKDVTASESSKKAEFYEGPWSSTQFDGKTWGLPLNSNNLALYYNKDMFTKAGLQAPTTWDELRTSAKKLTADGHNGIAMSAVKNEQGTFQFLPFLWQTGGDLKSYETDGAKALGYLKSLVDDGSMSKAVANYSQEDARTQFVTKKSAMMINGPWELQNLKTAGVNFGVAPLPKGERAATGMGGENVVTFEQGKNKAAAQKFMDFLAGAEGAKIYCDESGQLSARPDLAGKLKAAQDPDLQVFEKQLADAHARTGGKYAEVSAAVQESLQKVLTGAATPEAAAKDAAAKITPLLG